MTASGSTPRSSSGAGSPGGFDPETYRREELAGYEQVADAYDTWLATCTGRFAPALLEIGRVEGGQRVLDAACGPGVVTLLALPKTAPGGSCLGVDFSPRMIERARANAGSTPGVSFAVMDVERLDLPGAAYDRVLCGFGLMHVPDADAALREFHRVLKPGGRFAGSVWAGLEQVDFMRLILHTVKRVAPDAGFPPGPPMFGLGSKDALAPRLERAGFVDPEFSTVRIDLHFPDFDAYWNALVLGAARMGGVVRALPSSARERLVGELRRETGRLGAGGRGFTLAATAFLAAAVRPGSANVV